MTFPLVRARSVVLAGIVVGASALLCLRPSSVAAGQATPPAPGAKPAEQAGEKEEDGGDIVFQVVGSRMQKYSVLYRHDVHLAAGIKCEECHEKTFKKKLNGNQFKMADINRGQFCGTCHNAAPAADVLHKSFAPKNNCTKCHTLKLREP